MQRFFCGCGQQVFFESTTCVNCGTVLGFDPRAMNVLAVQNESADAQNAGDRVLFHCRNRLDYQVCNWLTQTAGGFCTACHCNHTIPNLGDAVNLVRWRALEQAKKRLVYTLLRLGLSMVSKWDDPERGLWFDFLESQPTGHALDEGFVSTGHTGGVITINVLEADSLQREAMRQSMGESYRTLLGHFRHESGHYYWQLLLPAETPARDAFRRHFGDERRDYQQALAHYYDQGPVADWGDRYISAYASAHAWEDWAETWGHYLHMSDTLETAHAYGMLRAVGEHEGFARRLQRWMDLTLTLNALNRSMGLSDAYPFVLSDAVRDKLGFIDALLAGVVPP